MSALDLPAQILERVPQPIWMIDNDGTVAFANEAAAFQLGYLDPLDLRGRPSHDTVHHHHPDGSDYPAAECPVLRPAVTGEPAAADDQWFIRRDGSLFPISWSAAPIELPNGRGTVLSFNDVSDRRQREDYLRQRRWREEVRREHPNVGSSVDRDMLLSELKDFVTVNLTDPALNPVVLARAHHISLRLLHAVFADSGLTPARYIREQRLTMVRCLLRDGLTVSAAARASGFADAGTLTRAFRRCFDLTPSEFVQKERTGRQHGDRLVGAGGRGAHLGDAG
jgi:PAS domain S-box-containing protein